MDAVVKAFYVNPKHAVKVSFGSALRIADVRDASIIDQNADAIMPDNFGKPGDDSGLISNVAGVGGRSSASAGDFRRNRLGVLGADIQDVDSGAIGGKLLRNRPANSATAAGDDCGLPVQAKLTCASIFAGQRETPRFQGMKSS